MIAGPAVFICGECVNLCSEIVGDAGALERARSAEAQAERFLAQRLRLEALVTRSRSLIFGIADLENDARRLLNDIEEVEELKGSGAV